MSTLPASIQAALHEARERLQEAFGGRLRGVFLFGSYAWGTPHADSDVDLCVVIDGLSHKERGQVIEIVAEVGIERDVLLAPLVWTQAEFDHRLARELALAEDIQQRGVRI